MAELKFIITADNKGMMEALQETQQAMRTTARNVEQIGQLLDLQEFRDASASVTDFASKLYDASRESVSNLSTMSQEFSSQANTIRQEMESMLGGGSMDGMADKLDAYKQAVMDASAAAETAYNVQGVAVATLADELDSLQQAQEAALSAGDSGTAQALQGDIDALSGTLEQAEEQLSQLGAQAETANQQLNNLDDTFAKFGGNAENVGSAFDGIKGKIGEATEATKNWLTGNGKFTEGVNSMKEALGGMGGAFTPAISGAKKMLVALRAMIATPIGAVLTAVVLALQAMHKWFTKSADGQRAFAKVSAFISSVLSSLTDIAVDVGKYLFRAFSDPNKPLGQFSRNLVSTFSNALKSVYHLVKSLANSLKSLGTIIKGIGTLDLDTISSGWDSLKNAGTLMAQAFAEAGRTAMSAFSTITSGAKAAAGVLNDVWNNVSFSSIEKGFGDTISKATTAMDLAGRQVDQTIKLQEAQAKQAEYDKQIGDKYAELYKLKGKERQDAINELKEMQKAKYDDMIAAQTQLYEITKKNNSLHSSTLEDLQKERDLRVQMLQTQAQQANSTRMLARMEASNERQMAATAAKAAKSGGRTTVIDLNAVREAEAALAELERKQDNERISQQVAMEEKLTAARIDAMKDGAEKVAALRDAENKRELLALAEQLKAAKEAEYQRQKARYEAEQKLLPQNERKPWEAAMLDQSAIDAIVKQYEELADLIKQKQQQIIEGESQSSMREYLKQYGTYQERRLAITEEYADKINKATTEGDKLILAKQRESALSALDKDFGLQTQQMADLFADASDKSVKAIEAIIGKYQTLVDYMKGQSDISREDLISIGFSEDDIDKIQRGEIKINDVIAAIEKLQNEVTRRSPFKAFAAELDNSLGKLKAGKTGEGLQGIGQAVNKFLPSVKEFGKNIASIFGFDDSAVQGVIDAVGGLGDAAAGVGQIMSGDIVGGIMNTAKGIGTIVNAVEGLFGADYSSYNKLVEQYDKLIDVWDDLLEKKREYLDTSYGAEALRAEKEMTDILAKETEAWRELGKERLNAGASAGSHSIGNRIIKQMSAEDWGDITKALGQNARKLLGDRLTGLFDLSSDQLSRLKEQAPAFWAKMDDDVRKYLQSIIDGAKQLDEVQKKAKEQLTQTTFEAMRDDFISKLADMETAAGDFSDDFSEMLFRAMLNTKVNEMFSDRLSKWYDQFAESMKDGEISESERNALLADYNNIVADAVKLRDTLADATGYSQSVSEGSGAYKAASSFSQEQGDELNGRLTAIQIGQAYQNEQLTMAVMTLQSMSVVGQEQGNTLVEMRNLMLIGNSHLEDIARYTKIAAQYGDAIETIADKIKTL